MLPSSVQPLLNLLTTIKLLDRSSTSLPLFNSIDVMKIKSYKLTLMLRYIHLRLDAALWSLAS